MFRRPLNAAELRNSTRWCSIRRAPAPPPKPSNSPNRPWGIVAVSCDARSFARDAAILIAGGYALGGVTPIDQFRFSPHVELVATFSRPAGSRRKKGLLSR